MDKLQRGDRQNGQTSNTLQSLLLMTKPCSASSFPPCSTNLQRSSIQTTEMKLNLFLTILLLVSAAVTADYVRPLPRKTLQLPRDSKPPSYPQQVTLFSMSFSLTISFFTTSNCWTIRSIVESPISLGPILSVLSLASGPFLFYWSNSSFGKVFGISYSGMFALHCAYWTNFGIIKWRS